MAKRTVRTIRKWAWNVTGEDVASVLKNFPGYIPFPPLRKNCSESRGKDKLILRAHYWHGEWSPETTEEYCRFYKP